MTAGTGLAGIGWEPAAAESLDCLGVVLVMKAELVKNEPPIVPNRYA